jgi:hypothetical protein
MQDSDGLNSLISSFLAIKTHAPTDPPNCSSSFPPPFSFLVVFGEKKKGKKQKTKTKPKQIKSNQLIDWCQG